MFAFISHRLSQCAQLFGDNTDIEGIDTTNACYGGTSAVFNRCVVIDRLIVRLDASWLVDLRHFFFELGCMVGAIANLSLLLCWSQCQLDRVVGLRWAQRHCRLR